MCSLKDRLHLFTFNRHKTTPTAHRITDLSATDALEALMSNDAYCATELPITVKAKRQYDEMEY